MDAEVAAAVNFVATFLYGKLPRRRVQMLGEELGKGIRARCQGHWYPDEPLKGTAHRCLAVTGCHPDSLLLDAAREIGLEIAEIIPLLPDSLTLWIDPGEVVYRIGDKGHVSTLYSQRASALMTFAAPTSQDGLRHPSPHLGHGGSQGTIPALFTPAAFAQTKFGSTKLRSNQQPGNQGNGAAARWGGRSGRLGDRRHGSVGHSHSSDQQHYWHHQPQQSTVSDQAGCHGNSGSGGGGGGGFNSSYELARSTWSTAGHLQTNQQRGTSSGGCTQLEMYICQ